jgi:hypothetical protein
MNDSFATNGIRPGDMVKVALPEKSHGGLWRVQCFHASPSGSVIVSCYRINEFGSRADFECHNFPLKTLSPAS